MVELNQIKYIYFYWFILLCIYFIIIIIILITYNINENELYNVILNNIKRLDKIKNTECLNVKNIILKCVNVESIFLNGSYKSVTLFKNSKIRYGLKTIRINDRIIIIKEKNITIYESFKIYFMKRVSINQYGSIITSTNQYISIKGGCRCNEEIKNITNNQQKSIYYHLVFQITQYLGSSIYHSIINCLTKIIPLMYAIKHLPYSKIHIHKNNAIMNYLHLLDIDNDKLVYGDISSTNIIIMDRVECTSSIYTNAVIELRDLLLRKIKIKYGKINKYKKIMLFIKRLYTRRIVNFKEVYSAVCNLYSNYTCRIYNPNTKFYKMIELFSNADIIFGPHGAGFTNIIVSKKEVMIFEIIKQNYPVLCFSTLSNILGYKYYGLYSKCDSSEAFYLNVTLILNYINDQFNI